MGITDFFNKDNLLEQLKLNLEAEQSEGQVETRFASRVYTLPQRKYLTETWPTRFDNLGLQISKLWTMLERSEEYGFKSWDMWALNYNNKLLTLTNAAGSLAASTVFRRQLGMRHTSAGLFSMLSPAIIGSVGIGMSLHTFLVLPSILNNPERSMPTAGLLLKSTAFHVGTSIFYNLLFASFTTPYFASRLSTFPIPSDVLLSAESRRYMYRQVLRPTITKNLRRLAILTALQASFALILTTFEVWQTNKLFIAHVEHFRE